MEKNGLLRFLAGWRKGRRQKPPTPFAPGQQGQSNAAKRERARAPLTFSLRRLRYCCATRSLRDCDSSASTLPRTFRKHTLQLAFAAGR